MQLLSLRISWLRAGLVESSLTVLPFFVDPLALVATEFAKSVLLGDILDHLAFIQRQRRIEWPLSGFLSDTDLPLLTASHWQAFWTCGIPVFRQIGPL
jgi:hypothetical protein